MQKKLFWLFLTAILATSGYMYFFYFGQHKIQIQIEPSYTGIRNRFYEISNYQFVEGETEFYFNQNITQLNIIPFPNYQIKEIRHLARNRFLILCDQENLASKISIFATGSLERSSDSLIFTATSRHQFRFSLFLSQFLFLLFLVGTFAAAVILIWRLLFSQYPLEPWAKLTVVLLTASFLTCFFYFLCKMPLHFLSEFGLSWSWLIVVNLVITTMLMATFFIFQEYRLSRILWFVAILVLLFLLFNPAYNPKKIGDARMLTFNLQLTDFHSVPLSEMLSLIWLKGIQVFFRKLGIVKDMAAVFTVAAKVLGVLYIFSLYFLTKTFSVFSEKGRIIFFIGALALPLSMMFTGIPELSFYPYPFMVFGIAFAIRHLQAPLGWGYYILALVFFMVAGFFHASGFFSLPALFLLPFFSKTSMGNGSQRKKNQRITGAIIAIATVVMMVIAVIGLLKLCGFQIGIGSARGGSDGKMLILFSPQFCNFASILFISNRYLWLHGWIVIAAFPLIFFSLPFLLRRVKLGGEELFLLLIALTQIVIPIFWGFDLGVRDFDLFITPFSGINLFFLLMFSRVAEGLKRYWVFLFFLLFGLLHPSYLIFRFASQ